MDPGKYDSQSYVVILYHLSLVVVHVILTSFLKFIILIYHPQQIVGDMDSARNILLDAIEHDKVGV